MGELSKDQAMIVKVINVIGNTQHGKDTIGYILYERSFSETYKLNESQETDFFKRMLDKETEERFPLDELDIIILDTIKTKFPESNFKSYLVLGGLGKDRYDHILKVPSQLATVNVTPDISGRDLNMLVGMRLVQLSKKINIYQNYSIEHIKGHFFNGSCNLERHEEIIGSLDRITFL